MHLHAFLGLKTPLSKDLMKAHFYKAINEKEHLEEMETPSAIDFGLSDFLQGIY